MGLFCLSCAVVHGQVGDLGTPIQPSDSAAVDPLPDYGPYMDMSGGYAVGDTAADFTVYDFDGNSVTLSEELASGKPVVMISGSVSCIRFRETYEEDNNAQEFAATRAFFAAHMDDFNWLYIYGVEAHPTDGNCPSNCPPIPTTDTAVVQPSFYGERRWALNGWMESEEHDFPFEMYADNPDNSVYNTFFERPFGLVALDCNGVVAFRGDWVTSFFLDTEQANALEAWGESWGECVDSNPDPDPDPDPDPVDPWYEGPDADLTDGDATEDDQISSVPSWQPSSLRMYPNPAHATLTVEWNGENMAQMLVHDMNGRLCHEEWLSPGQHTLNISHLVDGIYQVQMDDASMRVQEALMILH